MGRSLLFGIFLVLVWMLFGFFVYGGINGAFAVGILALLCWISVLLALIPFIGIIAQILVMLAYILPIIQRYTGIEANAFTTLILGVYAFYGLIIWFVVSKEALIKYGDYLERKHYRRKMEAKRLAELNSSETNNQ